MFTDTTTWQPSSLKAPFHMCSPFHSSHIHTHFPPSLPAAYMCCYRNTAAPSVSFWDEADPNAASLSAAAAVSVAARGLLWSNRLPAPSRWLPLKGPSCFMPERAANSNMVRLGAALQALQDDSRGRGEVLGLAGQLLHAGRQDRAAQVRKRGCFET